VASDARGVRRGCCARESARGAGHDARRPAAAQGAPAASGQRRAGGARAAGRDRAALSRPAAAAGGGERRRRRRRAVRYRQGGAEQDGAGAQPYAVRAAAVRSGAAGGLLRARELASAFGERPTPLARAPSPSVTETRTTVRRSQPCPAQCLHAPPVRVSDSCPPSPG